MKDSLVNFGVLEKIIGKKGNLGRNFATSTSLSIAFLTSLILFLCFRLELWYRKRWLSTEGIFLNASRHFLILNFYKNLHQDRGKKISAGNIFVHGPVIFYLIQTLDHRHTWSNLCIRALVIMDSDNFINERKTFWKNSCHLCKIIRYGILENIALKLLTFVVWLIFAFLFFLCLSLPLSPKALCWKTSPNKLVTLLNESTWFPWE